mmetsp:Transcript_8974/g.16852  ORF Transcript_8974/g.16852 Transcript_8974/m.16852 type:complete len:337 (-) Transcript_8974:919-1929(-)
MLETRANLRRSVRTLEEELSLQYDICDKQEASLGAAASALAEHFNENAKMGSLYSAFVIIENVGTEAIEMLKKEKRENEELKEELRKSRDAFEAASGDLKQSQALSREQQDAIYTMELQLAQLSATSKETESLRENFRVLQRQQNQGFEKCYNLVEQAGKAQAEIERLNSKILLLENERRVLEESNQSLSSRLGVLSNQFATLEHQHSSLKSASEATIQRQNVELASLRPKYQQAAALVSTFEEKAKRNETLLRRATELQTFYDMNKKIVCTRCRKVFTKATNFNVECSFHRETYRFDSVRMRYLWACCKDTDRNAPSCTSSSRHAADDALEGESS